MYIPYWDRSVSSNHFPHDGQAVNSLKRIQNADGMTARVGPEHCGFLLAALSLSEASKLVLKIHRTGTQLTYAYISHTLVDRLSI